MKNTPYSLRFTEAEQQQLADYCAANGIAAPEENAALKTFFLQLLTAPPAQRSSPEEPVEDSEAYLALQASCAELQEKYALAKADAEHARAKREADCAANV